jgi:hypothetical protein
MSLYPTHLLLINMQFFVCRPLTKEEKDEIYDRVMTELRSPALVAAETGRCNAVAIRNLIRERGGKLPLLYDYTLPKK